MPPRGRGLRSPQTIGRIVGVLCGGTLAAVLVPTFEQAGPDSIWLPVVGLAFLGSLALLVVGSGAGNPEDAAGFRQALWTFVVGFVLVAAAWEWLV